MKNIYFLILILLSLLLSACSKEINLFQKDNTIKEEAIIQEQIIEKPGTNSMEEIIVEGTISNMKDEKTEKVKLHKFIVPSMNIAIYDANPQNPEITVEDEQFNSDSEVEVPYYEIETPLPDLVKSNGGFIKMLTKDLGIEFNQALQSQDWKTILSTIIIDTNLDLGNINDITLEKTDNKDLVNINNITNIESYKLVSSTSKYLFYIYFDKTKPDRYFLVGIVDGCSSIPCSNIVSIEFLN